MKDLKNTLEMFLREFSYTRYSYKKTYEESWNRFVIIGQSHFSFKYIGEKMEEKLNSKIEIHTKLKLVFVWLLQDMAREYKLESPYPKNIYIEKMDMKKWVQFCQENSVTIEQVKERISETNRYSDKEIRKLVDNITHAIYGTEYTKEIIELLKDKRKELYRNWMLEVASEYM